MARHRPGLVQRGPRHAAAAGHGGGNTPGRADRLHRDSGRRAGGARLESSEVVFGVTGHEFRYKTGGDYPEDWTAIAYSAPDEANENAFTVTGLTNEVAHTFELRAVNAAGGGDAATAGPVTPTAGICDRTQQIQDAILAELSGVDDCAAVTVANLAAITSFGGLGTGTVGQGISSLQKGDFAGLTSLTVLNLSRNTLTIRRVARLRDLPTHCP